MPKNVAFGWKPGGATNGGGLFSSLEQRETWRSPLLFGSETGEMRPSEAGARGKFGIDWPMRKMSASVTASKDISN